LRHNCATPDNLLLASGEDGSCMVIVDLKFGAPMKQFAKKGATSMAQVEVCTYDTRTKKATWEKEPTSLNTLVHTEIRIYQ
ncbi:MAG: hypothetical protein LBE97_00445, partial [Holosporales bacterium]|nr:hypothetical protein [Holosporales bacterium]